MTTQAIPEDESGLFPAVIETPHLPSVGNVGSLASVGPLKYLHGYCNAQNGTRPNCGQAAVATVLDAWGFDPYHLPRTAQDPRDSRMYWQNDDIVLSIEQQFPNRWVPIFGQVGMFPEDVMQSLQSLSGGNVNVTRSFSGLAAADWEKLWEALKLRMSRGIPTIVLLDAGVLGPNWFAGHYVVAYNYDPDLGVAVSNSQSGSEWIPENIFLSAWHCRAYPYRTNHLMIDFWKLKNDMDSSPS